MNEPDAIYNEMKRFQRLTQFLWELLDNIDTLDDSCREHDDLFRERTRKQQKRRWDTGATSDGQTVDFSYADVYAKEV